MNFDVECWRSQGIMGGAIRFERGSQREEATSWCLVLQILDQGWGNRAVPGYYGNQAKSNFAKIRTINKTWS